MRAVPVGALVTLDVYGHNHNAELWGDPCTFRPERFRAHPPGRDRLITRGGGDPAEAPLPREDIAVALLHVLAGRLAGLEYRAPEQRLTVSLRRFPRSSAQRFRHDRRPGAGVVGRI